MGKATSSDSTELSSSRDPYLHLDSLFDPPVDSPVYERIWHKSSSSRFVHDSFTNRESV